MYQVWVDLCSRIPRFQHNTNMAHLHELPPLPNMYSPPRYDQSALRPLTYLLLFELCIKFLGFIQGIKFTMHKIIITIPKVIINKSDEILIPSTYIDIKGSHTTLCTNVKHSLTLCSLE